MDNSSQIRRDLLQVGEDLSRMKDRTYRSPDEAYAQLIQVQTQLNHALGRLSEEPNTYSMLTVTLPETMEQLIGAFIDRARDVARKFKAADFSVQVSGFPPSVSLSLSWSMGS